MHCFPFACIYTLTGDPICTNSIFIIIIKTMPLWIIIALFPVADIDTLTCNILCYNNKLAFTKLQKFPMVPSYPSNQALISITLNIKYPSIKYQIFQSSRSCIFYLFPLSPKHNFLVRHYFELCALGGNGDVKTFQFSLAPYCYH